MLSKIFFIISILIIDANPQRLMDPRKIDELGLDDNAYDNPTNGPTDQPTTQTTTTTIITTTTTMTTTMTTTANKTANNDKLVKRIAKAIKKEVDAFSAGEIAGVTSGTFSVVAFLVWLAYHAHDYITTTEGWTFDGLRRFIFRLFWIYMTRLRDVEVRRRPAIEV